MRLSSKSLIGTTSILVALYSCPSEAFLRLQFNNNNTFWNMNNMTTPMPYSVNPNISDNAAGGNADQLAAVQNAANTWNTQANANFQFAYQGTTTIDTAIQDGINIVAARQDCAPIGNPPQCACGNTIAAGSAQIATLATGEIIERDILVCDGNFTFFASQNPANLPAQAEFDLWGLLVHEMGHNLGLNHPFEANPSQGVCAIMQQNWFTVANCNWPWGDAQNRNLAPDDITGIQTMYGIFNPDFDGDGILNPNDNCPNVANPGQADFNNNGQGDVCDLDADNDGLSNENEAKFGSNPLNPDTDGDGLSDGDEVNKYGTSPTQMDTDGDGLSDGDEVSKYGTPPTQADSDGDGINDSAEIQQGLSPTINEGAVLIIINSLLLDNETVKSPPPSITGIPTVPVLTVPKNSVLTAPQNTIIKSDIGLSSVKMECGGGTPIKGSPVFVPAFSQNIYSFHIIIGPVKEAVLCQIKATDIAGQTTAVQFQVMPGQ